MNNEPNQSQWNQWPLSQYSQPQSGQWGQWGQQQPPTQYNPQQYVQPQYNANAQYNQYNAQYGVPPVPQYAQVQPQQQADKFLMGWLMTRVIVRIVFIVLPLLLCGGCALFAVLSSLAR